MELNITVAIAESEFVPQQQPILTTLFQRKYKQLLHVKNMQQVPLLFGAKLSRPSVAYVLSPGPK